MPCWRSIPAPIPWKRAQWSRPFFSQTYNFQSPDRTELLTLLPQIAEIQRQLDAEIFSEPYLLKRPLLNAITRDDHAPVLLIDEVDRADEEFEAFLLEILSDFQVTIPELGTVHARHRPYVVLTSNRTRELSDALKRRCLY